MWRRLCSLNASCSDSDLFCRLCDKTRDCFTFTFVEGSPLGLCRGYKTAVQGTPEDVIGGSTYLLTGNVLDYAPEKWDSVPYKDL